MTIQQDLAAIKELAKSVQARVWEDYGSLKAAVDNITEAVIKLCDALGNQYTDSEIKGIKRIDRSPLFIKFSDGVAELLCSFCKRSLWSSDRIHFLIGNMNAHQVIYHLLQLWAESNGDVNIVQCCDCREKP